MSQQLDKETEKKLLKDLKEDVLRSHLNIFILTSIRTWGELSGYDLLGRFRKKFGVNISVGTMYSQLHALERKRLIECNTNSEAARKYVLTLRGANTLDIVLLLKQQILELVDAVFSP